MAIADRLSLETSVVALPSPKTVDTLDAAVVRAEAEVRRTLLAVAPLSGHTLTMPADLQRLHEQYEDAVAAHNDATLDWYVALLAKHLPGLAPAVYAVWAHVQDEMHRSSMPCCSKPGSEVYGHE